MDKEEHDVEDVVRSVDSITEFNEISEFLKDSDVDEVLHKIIKIIAKPDLPPAAAIKVLVELQALSAKFHLQASSFTYLTKPKAGTDEYKKKSMYYSLAEELNKLCATLKYVLRDK